MISIIFRILAPLLIASAVPGILGGIMLSTLVSKTAFAAPGEIKKPDAAATESAATKLSNLIELMNTPEIKHAMGFDSVIEPKVDDLVDMGEQKETKLTSQPFLTATEFPDALTTQIMTYFPWQERVVILQRVSHRLKTAVWDSFKSEVANSHCEILIPDADRDKATPLDVYLHAQCPLMAIELIDKFHFKSENSSPYLHCLISSHWKVHKPDIALHQKLQFFSKILKKESSSRKLIEGLIQWGATDRIRAYPQLCQVFSHLNSQLVQASPAVPAALLDLLSFCRIRGIGTDPVSDLEKISEIDHLAELKLTQKERLLIRSDRLRSYLRIRPILRLTDVTSDTSWPTQDQIRPIRESLSSGLLYPYECDKIGEFLERGKDYRLAFLFYTEGVHVARVTSCQDLSCQNKIGEYYEDGRGVEIDIEKALSSYLSAISKWATEPAIWNLRELSRKKGFYQKLLPHLKKEFRTLSWHQSVQNMNMISFRSLIWILGSYLDDSQNNKKPVDRRLINGYWNCLQLLAEEKNPYADLFLADFYFNGLDGSGPDLKKAFDSLEKAQNSETERVSFKAKQRLKAWTTIQFPPPSLLIAEEDPEVVRFHQDQAITMNP